MGRAPSTKAFRFRFRHTVHAWREQGNLLSPALAPGNASHKQRKESERRKYHEKIAILNIKGGVAKTTSALAISQILNDEYKQRVLLIDADQQGNTTRTLLPDAEINCGTAELLTSKEPLPYEELIRPSEYGIHVIGAGFKLMEANKACMLDTTRPQQLRFKRALKQIAAEDKFDYCIIDCPPDISMAAINALAIADDVLIPIRADKYGFDGLNYMMNTIEELRESNEKLQLAGCFLTMTSERTNLAQFAKEVLTAVGVPAMKTSIRQCTKVGESTFGKPLMRYAPRCTAAEDYRALVKEYLKGE